MGGNLAICSGHFCQGYLNLRCSRQFDASFQAITEACNAAADDSRSVRPERTAQREEVTARSAAAATCAAVSALTKMCDDAAGLLAQLVSRKTATFGEQSAGFVIPPEVFRGVVVGVGCAAAKTPRGFAPALVVVIPSQL